MEDVKILAVDDDRIILNVLNRALGREGIQLETTQSPVRALELLPQETYSIIISDHNMPEMQGIELLEKARKISPSTIRIMLTGDPNQNTVIDAINRGGVYKFLTKPWQDDQLFSIVQEALSAFEAVHSKSLTEASQETLLLERVKRSQSTIEKTRSTLHKILESILVIGTMGIINFQLKFLLRQVGKTIDIVNSVDQALQAFMNKNYGLVILDPMLPAEQDGIFLLGRIQQLIDESHLSCKLVVLSPSAENIGLLQTTQKERKMADFIIRAEGWQTKLLQAV